MKILSMDRGRMNIEGFRPAVKGQQPKWGKDGRISNQKGAFGRAKCGYIIKEEAVQDTAVQAVTL